MTMTQLTGDALLEAVGKLDSTVTATEKCIACGYIKENGKADYVEFYTALIEAKGLNEPTEDPEMSEKEEELRESFGNDAVDAFIEMFSINDLDYFEDAYQGEWESGAKFAEELVSECYFAYGRDLPSWVSIDWEDTWDNLSYDYCEENGFIFRTNF